MVAPAATAGPGTAVPDNPPILTREALNAEQQSAVDKLMAGSNIFLTGAAGVGKSYVLRYIIQECERRYGAEGVAVTAPTGIAASHLSGVTLHSFAGIGLGKGGRDKLLPKVLSNQAAMGRWRAAQVLIIDEVSMLDSILFDLLEEIARTVRGSSRPFGGMQVICCGDFLQLPPVSLGHNGAGFAFEGEAWTRCGIETVALTQIVRQSGDPAFASMLGQIRTGVCSAATSAALALCHVDRKPAPSDGILPTKLYCTNHNVDDENSIQLAKLDGDTTTLVALDTFKGRPNADERQRLLDAIEKKAVGALPLKIGAQVILTINIPKRRLVNGSRGIVTGFTTVQSSAYGVPLGIYHCPRVRFDSPPQEMIVMPFSMFQGGPGGALVRIAWPLKFAWALTVHKSQGMSLSRAELMLDDAFDFGQAYVALSRVTALEGLWIRGGLIDQRVIKAHPIVLAFYNQWQDDAEPE